MNNNQNQIGVGSNNTPTNKQYNAGLNQTDFGLNHVDIDYTGNQTHNERQKSLANIERITRLMDSQFGFLGFRFGIDPIINLIPFAGATVSAIISGMLVAAMAKHGASGNVKAKMIINITFDALIGMIPVLGWIFDFYYKANRRNFNLLKQHYQLGKHQGSSAGVFVPILLIILFVLAMAVYFVVQIISWIFE